MAMKMDLDIASRYLTGKINANEKEIFEKWLRESLDHFQQFDEF